MKFLLFRITLLASITGDWLFSTLRAAIIKALQQAICIEISFESFDSGQDKVPGLNNSFELPMAELNSRQNYILMTAYKLIEGLPIIMLSFMQFLVKFQIFN